MEISGFKLLVGSASCVLQDQYVASLHIICTISNKVCCCIVEIEPYAVLSDYKSFIEQGGGGAVPIYSNQSDEYFEKLIPRLNGVLLPGGGSNLISSSYGKAAYKIFKLVISVSVIVHLYIGNCQHV